MKFEWDSEKEENNRKKHGISFAVAARVFLNPNRVELYDAKHSEKEERYHVIGKVGRILTVIYTERGKNTRIISARIATKKERGLYYGNGAL